MGQSLLIKIDRIAAWALLPLMIIFIISGYSMLGKYGMDSVLNFRLSRELHLMLLDIPLVICFLVHSSIRIYFAMRRWGWIGKRQS